MKGLGQRSGGKWNKTREQNKGKTYNDDATNKDEVPYEILFLRELGIALFHLAQI